MKKARLRTKGFTLIATLLMLLLLSGIAIGLMMMVNTEGKVGGTDLQNDIAYHAAEGGIETMYTQLSSALQNSQVPTVAVICGVNTQAPTIPGITFPVYQVQTSGSVNCSSSTAAQQSAALKPNWGEISSGPNQGLYASIIPVNMTVTAATLGGQEASMMRQAQIAMIPVFQFGMFCDADCSIFPGSGMTFAGPVHSNGDFYPYVGSGATLTFQGKISAYGNIVRTVLPNTNSGSSESGSVYVPTSSASNACSTTTTNCTKMDAVGTDYGDGSVTGDGSSTAQPAGSISSYWTAFSQTTTNSQVINGNYYTTGASTPQGTGAKKLSMPFVNGTNFPYEIIRRPPSGESPTSALGQSREYNMAQIHILLDDDPNDLPGGASDANNIRLANITSAEATATSAAATNPYGITMTAGNYPSSYAAGTYQLYFAAATNALPSAGTVLASTTSNGADAPDWPYAPAAWYGNVYNTNSSLQGLQPTGPSGGPGAPILSGNNASAAPALVICPPYSTTAPPQDGYPTGCPSTSSPASPYYVVNGAMPTSSAAEVSPGTATWNLIDGYLRVEYLNNSGQWVGVTQEWLNLGFARGVTPPTSPGTNPINPNAILLLQQPAERQTPSSFAAGLALPTASATLATIGAGTAPFCVTQTTGSNPKCTEWTAVPPLLADSGATQWQFGTSSSPTTQSVTQFNWYPLNFYDAREGEPRDINWSSTYGTTDNTCTANGVMNAVEIDVGNLQKWLLGTTGSSGPNVNSSNQNGYILYFSDRRGMLVSPNAVSSHPADTKTGDSGLEDVINAASVPGVTNGTLEPVMTGQTVSPEDDNGNGVLDNWGAYNLGLSFYGTVAVPTTKNLNSVITNGTPNPYGTVASGTTNRIQYCGTTGRKNWVSGARHVLKLVDGALGNLPLNPTPTVITSGGTTTTYNGGFTVASENPVYVQGNYNSSATDTTWNNPPTDAAGMASAAIITDSVTLLSNSWDDRVSMLGTTGNNSPSNQGNRVATTTYYRMAIAAGKNRTFTYPTTSWTNQQADTGTDGGIHNFLHLLENWSGVTENYKGSLASLYYSTYNTGIYKCCTAVYGVPTRNFYFDLDFESPYGLPPGTPMFKDVESLSYRQLFTPRTD